MVFTASTPAWATISSCPPNGTTATLASFGSQSLTDGCAATDINYVNFSDPAPLAGGTIVNGITLSATNYVDKHGNNTCTGGTGDCPPDNTKVTLTSSLIQSDTVQFNSPGPQTNGTPVNGCGATGGSGGWCLNGSDLAMSDAFTFTIQSNTSTPIQDVGFDVTAYTHSSSNASGAAAVLFFEICPNTTTWTSGCSGEATLQGGTINGSPPSGTTFVEVQNFGAGYTSYAVQAVVYLSTTGGDGDWATLSAVDLIDTPEPYSMGLVGSGLALLGFLRYRRRSCARRARS